MDASSSPSRFEWSNVATYEPSCRLMGSARGAVALFDGDLLADYIVASCNNEVIFVSDVAGSPRQTRVATFDGFRLPRIVAGDFDGDGCQDVTYSAQVRFGDCLGRLSEAVPLTVRVGIASPALVADLDQDTRDDIVYSTTGGIRIFRFQADRTVVDGPSIDASVFAAPEQMAAGQWVDGGGLELAYSQAGEIYLFRFTAQGYRAIEWANPNPSGKDVDGVDFLGGTLIVGFAQRFSPRIPSLVGYAPDAVGVPVASWIRGNTPSDGLSTGDLTGDGNDDLLSLSTTWLVSVMDGTRLGEAPETVASCEEGGGCGALQGVPTILDVDGDGDNDIVLYVDSGTIGRPPLGNLYVLRQTTR